MRRLAIFVEGYTELLFIDRLINEIAEKSQIAIEHRKIRGGGVRSGIPRRFIELQSPSSSGNKSLYFLIVDCGGEKLVPQRIREEHESLTQKGYEKILGVRDVFPNFSKADLPALRRGLRYRVKTSLAPVQFVLSVMEIEAWFLAEHKHFLQVDPALTVNVIRDQLGFDPVTEDMTSRPEPANDLVAAYAIVGKMYKKGDAKTTVDNLDYDHLYTELRGRIPELNELLGAIDEFIKPPLAA